MFPCSELITKVNVDMMKLFGQIYDSHFNKLLLAALFIVVVALAVHLMHKSDAGGDDAGFIVWAETQAAFILGTLLGMMPRDKPPATATDVPSEPKILTANPDQAKKETP